MKIDSITSLADVYQHAKVGLQSERGFQVHLEQEMQKKKAAPLSDEEKKKEEAELRKAVQGFESYFIHQILKKARSGLPVGGLIPKSNAESIFEDMLDEKRAEEMTKVGGIGLTEALMKQLTKK